MSFKADVSAWINAVKDAAGDAAIGMAKIAFNHMLYISPQYSGDYAANWKVGFDRVDDSFDMNAVSPDHHGYRNSEGLAEVAPYKRGDMPAINYAKGHASWDGFRLGQSIYLSNSAFHPDRDEGGYGVIEPYAWKIENGEINFRPVNEGAAHIARRGASYVANRFKTIDAGKLALLRGLA